MKPKAKPEKAFPDYANELARLSKISGQIAGIEKMIRDRRYCPEIAQQIRAARSALRGLEIEILKGHLSSCIKDSAREDSSVEFDRKLTELMDLIKS